MKTLNTLKILKASKTCIFCRISWKQENAELFSQIQQICRKELSIAVNIFKFYIKCVIKFSPVTIPTRKKGISDFHKEKKIFVQYRYIFLQWGSNLRITPKTYHQLSKNRIHSRIIILPNRTLSHWFSASVLTLRLSWLREWLINFERRECDNFCLHQAAVYYYLCCGFCWYFCSRYYYWCAVAM